jgi:hypothetical protein
MLQFSQYYSDKKRALFKLNRQLGSVGVPHLINETFIAKFHAELATYHDPASAYFWLLYARITEAALLCAGHYADNLEYSAAGDLLVNPRRIHVYNKGSGVLEQKNRHGSVSEQFKPKGVDTAAFRKNFSSSMETSIEEPALLPLMADTLTRSGLFCENYLSSINQRMEKIADTIAFLSAWSSDNTLELHERLSLTTPESNKFIMSNLCRFLPTVFGDMGRELYRIECNRPTISAFLKKDCHEILHLEEESEHLQRCLHT